MIVLPDIAGAESSGDRAREIVLVPVHIVAQDGSVENAYIQQQSQHPESLRQQQKWQKKLTFIYLVVGTIALALSAYATARVLHKSK